MGLHRGSGLAGCAMLLVMWAAVSDCATPSGGTAPQAQLRTVRAELLAQGDADSLATAAFLERITTGQWRDAPQWAARATALAPDRADLAYMSLLLCYQRPSCSLQPLAARLRALDPGNGISWLFDLGRGTRAADAAATDAALAGLEHSQRVDLYWTALVSHMTAALAGRAGFQRSAAFESVVGIDAALVMPPLRPVSQACSDAAIAREDVRDRCRRIAAAFEHADTLLFESYGNRLAARLWPAGSATGLAIAAERRTLDYRRAQWRRRDLSSPQAVESLAGFYGQFPTEQAALIAWYADRGVAADPPVSRP